MATATELLQVIGRTGTLSAGPLDVRVRVTDVKQAYGRTRFHVCPVAGNGAAWVDAERVTLDSEERQ